LRTISDGAIAARLDMRLPPNVHAFVLATAFITSLAFAILAMNVLAGILLWTQWRSQQVSMEPGSFELR